MKIKIFKNHDFVRLEEKVNLFIRDVKVISTQLTIIPPTEESYTQYGRLKDVPTGVAGGY